MLSKLKLEIILGSNMLYGLGKVDLYLFLYMQYILIALKTTFS